MSFPRQHLSCMRSVVALLFLAALAADQSGGEARPPHALERHRSHALRQGTSAFTGARVQVLGYMMTEVDHPLPTGKRGRELVLLPDAGNLPHPAHRFGDQMIAVHLAVGEETAFVSRSLVWIKGLLRASSGDPAGAKLLYHLEEATAFPAKQNRYREKFSVNAMTNSHYVSVPRRARGNTYFPSDFVSWLQESRVPRKTADTRIRSKE